MSGGGKNLNKGRAPKRAQRYSPVSNEVVRRAKLERADWLPPSTETQAEDES